MNPLHLKVEQNKQVKQLWSGATDILKRSEQPHSGQLIGGSFLKKTLIEGDRKWKWMNERKKKCNLETKKNNFFRQLWRLGKSSKNCINSRDVRPRPVPASTQERPLQRNHARVAIPTCFHVSKNGIKFTHPTNPTYPLINAPSSPVVISTCYIAEIASCVAFSWYGTKSGSVFSFWTVPAINSWGLESWRKKRLGIQRALLHSNFHFQTEPILKDS